MPTTQTEVITGSLLQSSNSLSRPARHASSSISSASITSSPIDEFSSAIWPNDHSGDTSLVGEDDDSNDVASVLDHEDLATATILDNNALIQQSKEAIERLERLLGSPGWKIKLRHPSGVHIWAHQEKGETTPTFRGEKVIEGFTPEQVLSVVRSKRLWDNWYESGNLVDDLDQSTCLTYLVMKAHVPSTKPRDLVLVERLAEREDHLLFASTSVNTELCPPVPGRIRAHLHLNGWRLEACQSYDGKTSTKLSYILQTSVGGNAPKLLQKKFLARRPLVIRDIESYLKQYGVPVFPTEKIHDDILSSRASMTPSASWSSSTGKKPSNSSKTSCPSTITSQGSQSTKRSRPVVSFMEPDKEVATRPGEDDASEIIEEEVGLHHRPSSTILKFEEDTVEVAEVTEEKEPVSQSTPPLDVSAYATSEASSNEQDTLTQGNSQAKKENGKAAAVARPLKIEMPPPAIGPPSSSSSRLLSSLPPSPFNSYRQSTAPAQPPNHRFAAHIMKSRQLTNDLYPLDTWQFQTQTKDVRISTIPVPNKPMPAVRGDMTITGWTVEEIMAVIRSTDCRFFWDERFDGGELIERLDARSSLIHTSVKGSFPVSGRDFCIAMEVRFDPEMQALQFISCSVEDPKVPPTSKRVRAHLDLGAWILKPSLNDPSSVDVTYITQVDIKGNVPNSLLKTVQNQTPLCIAKINEFLTKYVAPPTVSRTTLITKEEKYEIERVRWSVQLASDAANAQVRGAEIKLGKKSWLEAGYVITTEPANTEVIRVEHGFRVVIRGQGSATVTVGQNEKHNGCVLVNGVDLGVGQSSQPKQPSPASNRSTPAVSPFSSVRQRKPVERAAISNGVQGSPKLAFSSSISGEKSVVAIKSSGKSAAHWSRKSRNVAGQPVPTRMTRLRRLTDGQVALMTFIAFIAFYTGLLYERYFVGLFLSWWQNSQ